MGLKKIEQWSYLETHTRSWGDTLNGTRLIKQLKKTHPYSALTVMKHSHDVMLTSSILYTEGIADSFVALPLDEGIKNEAVSLSNFFNRWFIEKFDRIILGWCYEPYPIDELFDRTNAFRDCKNVYAETGYDDLYKNSAYDIQPIESLYPELVNSSDHFLAWSLDDALKGLYAQLDPEKPIVAIHPISTRVFSRFTSKGLENIAKLLSDDYSLIALGQLGRFYKDCAPDWLFPCLEANGYYNWIGLSPLKQLAVMRHQNTLATIITPCGAMNWALLYSIPTIMINGGELRGNYWAEKNASIQLLDVQCDRIGCNDKTRYEACKHEPQCLNFNDEITLQKLLETIQTQKNKDETN